MKAKGSQHYRWKGDSVGYIALHKYVRKYWLKDACENCGSTKYLQVANISGKYKRLKSDWKTLCSRCHFHFDGKNKNIHFQRKPGSTGYRGVYFHQKNRLYVARIMIENKYVQIGASRHLETAVMMRLAAEEQLL